MKIYTKAGDKGNTALIGGTQVPKSDIRIETYGTVDELNSHLGMCRDMLNTPHYNTIIKEIQDRLFTIGAALACDPATDTPLKIPDLLDTDVALLETEIDRMNEDIPPMRNFILPGGHSIISQLHITRCVCRRAERLSVALLQATLPTNALIIQYLNRLSDYLFVVARQQHVQLNIPEIPWKPRV